MALLTALVALALAPPPPPTQPEPLDPLQYLGFSGIPVVCGVVEMLKRIFPAVEDRLWPPVAILTAIAWNVWIAGLVGLRWELAVTFGLVTGLAASGLYSQASTYRKAPNAS